MAGRGVGALVEAFRILLDVLDGFAVRREAGVGLVEEEKVIVPFAERFLRGLVTFGEFGDGFGGVGAGFCEVACGFRGFAEGVKILIVVGVETAGVFGEPALGDVDELCAAEIEIEGGAEDGFEIVEPELDFLLFLLEAFDELALGFFSAGGEVFTETFGVGSAIVGVEEIGLDVCVAHLACCAADFAERALKGLGLPVDAGDSGGENEEFQGGFDTPGGGTETVDSLGRGFFEAGCNGCLEHQALAEEGGNRLRHDVTFR
jgi:hypothetical protein